MELPSDLSFDGKLFILRTHRLGRVPTALYSAEILSEHGISCIACEFGESKGAGTFIDASIPRWRLPYHAYKWLPSPLRSGALFIQTYLSCASAFKTRGKPKLILSHGLTELVLAWCLYRKFGIPYAAHVHEVYVARELPWGFLKLLCRFEGPALKQAAFTLFSEANRQRIYSQRYQLKNPSFLAFNCPRRRSAMKDRIGRHELGLKKDDFMVLYVGGIGEKNAVVEAVQALGIYPHMHLVLLGWAPDSLVTRLVQLVDKLDARARFHFMGEVENKWRYLDSADLALCIYQPDELRTQWVATASNKLMEAISAGAPVLVYDNPDFRDFLLRYDVGYGLTEISGRALGKKIGEIAADRKTLLAKSESALEFHRSVLNYDRQFRPVLEAYLKVFNLLPQKVASHRG